MRERLTRSMLEGLAFRGNVVVKKKKGGGRGNEVVGWLPRKAARQLDCYFRSPDSVLEREMP